MQKKMKLYIPYPTLYANINLKIDQDLIIKTKILWGMYRGKPS